MDQKQFFRDIFEPYFHTHQAMDDRMMGIIREREKFEKTLDGMWANFRAGYVQQAIDYRQQVKYIKDAGLEVLRSKSTGKHKITYKRR